MIAEIAADQRLLCSQVSLLFAIHLSRQEQGSNPVQVSRRSLMQLSKIGSISTYHRNIKALHAYGYIRYEPSYHPRLGSRVYLLILSKNDGTAE